MSRYKRVNTTRSCCYCHHKFDRGWSTKIKKHEYFLCDTCKEKFEEERKQKWESSLLFKIQSKFKKLEDAWLWFVAIVFTLLGFAAFCVWVGSILMFFQNLIKG